MRTASQCASRSPRRKATVDLTATLQRTILRLVVRRQIRAAAADEIEQDRPVAAGVSGPAGATCSDSNRSHGRRTWWPDRSRHVDIVRTGHSRGLVSARQTPIVSITATSASPAFRFPAAYGGGLTVTTCLAIRASGGARPPRRAPRRFAARPDDAKLADARGNPRPLRATGRSSRSGSPRLQALPGARAAWRARDGGARRLRGDHASARPSAAQPLPRDEDAMTTSPTSLWWAGGRATTRPRSRSPWRPRAGECGTRAPGSRHRAQRHRSSAWSGRAWRNERTVWVRIGGHASGHHARGLLAW